jgi:hypothetical protein
VLSQRKANRSPNQCVYYSDGILREMGGDDLVSQKGDEHGTRRGAGTDTKVSDTTEKSIVGFP